MENEEKNVSREELKEAVIEKKFSEKDIAENKYVAMLSYVGILFLVPLLLKKESAFAQFHAKQGLVIAIVWIIGSFIFWIPLFGWVLATILFIVNIMALVKTYNGEAWEIPGAQEIVKKLNV